MSRPSTTVVAISTLMAIGCRGDLVDSETEVECKPVAIAPWDPPSAPIQAPHWDAAQVIPDAENIDGFAVRYGKLVIVERVDSSHYGLRTRDEAGSWAATTIDAGAGTMASATVFPARDGSIHLIWTRSRDGGGDPPDNLRPVEDVMYSRLDGSVASAEEVLFSGQRIEEPLRVVEDDAGAVHVVVTVGETIRDIPSIQYLHFRNGAWSDPVELDDGFGPDLTLTRDGEMVIAYNRIGPPPSGDGPTGDVLNPIFVMRTADGCPTTPDLVHAGSERSGRPSVTSLDDGSVMVVWPQDIDGQGIGMAEDVWYSRSEDLTSWTAPMSIAGELPGATGIGLLERDNGGAIHLTFGHFATRGWPPQPPHTPYFARFVDGSGWEVEDDPLGVIDGTIWSSVDELGRLHLLVLERREDADDLYYYVPPEGG